jgi:hypothetical protein
MKQIRNWIDFILTEGNEPAIVEAVNGWGGMAEGMRFKAFDKHKNHIAIWNQCGRAVWSHRKIFKIIEKGSVL